MKTTLDSLVNNSGRVRLMLAAGIVAVALGAGPSQASGPTAQASIPGGTSIPDGFIGSAPGPAPIPISPLGVETLPFNSHLPSGEQLKVAVSSYFDLDRTVGKKRMWDGTTGLSSSGTSFLIDQSDGWQFTFYNQTGSEIPLTASMDGKIYAITGLKNTSGQLIPGSIVVGLTDQTGRLAFVYKNLDTYDVNEGDLVKRGDLIGRIRADSSTNKHLNYIALRYIEESNGTGAYHLWDHFADITGQKIEDTYDNKFSLTIRQNCFEFLDYIKQGFDSCFRSSYGLVDTSRLKIKTALPAIFSELSIRVSNDLKNITAYSRLL